MQKYKYQLTILIKTIKFPTTTTIIIIIYHIVGNFGVINFWLIANLNWQIYDHVPLSMGIMVQNGKLYFGKWLSKPQICQNFPPAIRHSVLILLSLLLC